MSRRAIRRSMSRHGPTIDRRGASAAMARAVARPRRDRSRCVAEAGAGDPPDIGGWTGDGDQAERSDAGGRRGEPGSPAALSLLAFLPVASRMPMYARLVTSLVLDERMPSNRKALLAGAAGYLVLGRDLIPDDMPIIGGLDDLVVVVLAVELFLDGVPDDLLTRSSTSSASIAPLSTVTSPRSGA